MVGSYYWVLVSAGRIATPWVELANSTGYNSKNKSLQDFKLFYEFKILIKRRSGMFTLLQTPYHAGVRGKLRAHVSIKPPTAVSPKSITDSDPRSPLLASIFQLVRQKMFFISVQCGFPAVLHLPLVVGRGSACESVSLFSATSRPRNSGRGLSSTTTI